MGNDQSNGSTFLSMTRLPKDVIGKPEMVKYNIKTGSIGDGIYGKHFVTVEFPDGWTTENSGEYWVNYIDPQGYERFSCFSKMCDYEQDAHTHFHSDEEAQECYMKKQVKIAAENTRKKKECEFNDEVNKIFSKEWSQQDKYIVYYFRSGRREADSYMAGYAKDSRYDDCVIEFGSHKFIGYADSIDKVNIFCKLFKEYDCAGRIPNDYDVVVVRKLPDGISNLHRFEIKHMFGIDPNLTKSDSGSSYYDGSLFTQIKTCGKYAIELSISSILDGGVFDVDVV